MRKLTKRETFLVEKTTQKLIIIAKAKAFNMRPDQYSIERENWCEGYIEALRWMLDLIIGD